MSPDAKMSPEAEVKVTPEARVKVRLTIDGKACAAYQGETVLEVGRREGFAIPALCHIAETAAWGACRLCLVEVEGQKKLQAACTTWVAEGMDVKTNTPRIRAKRESYLRMYLSDHNAYCEAPCSHACPTHIDIPAYMAALAAGDAAGAAAIVRTELPFPGILGRICPRYCEPVCRRADVDEPIAICALHRALADHVSASGHDATGKAAGALRCAASSGKRVAVVGAGPGGLTAAWFLAERGHQVTLYGAEEKPGGALRYLEPRAKLPELILDQEIQPLWDAGVRFVGGSELARAGDASSLLDAGFDAVVEDRIKFELGTDDLAGAAAGADSAGPALVVVPDPAAKAVPTAHRFTGRTSREGVFAAGNALGTGESVIHTIGAGKRTALAVDAWLRGQDLAALEKELAAYSALPYLEQLRDGARVEALGRRLAERAPVWLKMGASAEPAPRAVMPVLAEAKRSSRGNLEIEPGLSLAAAQEEAKRCLQCRCPSLGACELQKLGVEYGITTNPLVTKTSQVRTVEPQYEHPFIRRNMERCISCGRCVRVCRDVAGPACYDFTGRGFTMKVDTPYGDSLQLAQCITCGRCVSTCPTGALTFNERQLSSFRVDESRCILCRECVEVCPVGALKETNQFEEARRRWLELVGQGSGLAGGHRMCAGCGAPIVVRQVLMGTSDPVVVCAATGCLEVSTTIYPYTSWKGSYIHTAFENAAATLSGVETAFRAMRKKGAIDENVKFVAFGGDGGTYDIGLQSLSGAMERGHKMLYVCYDNGAYMNTGFQRSGATPVGAWTTTSPVGKEMAGKVQNRKNLTELMIAHGLKYVAQASPHDPRDLVRKAAKALAVDGPTFLNVLSPCPRGWRSDGAESVDLAREAVNTCYWPLFEYEEGEYHLTYRPHHKLPLVPWLKRQGRFAHLFQPGFEETLASIEAWVDSEWEKLLCKCGEPGEAEWQEHLQADGCLLR